MHEGELLHHIAQRSADLHGFAGRFGRVLLGPGDDAAVIETPGGQRCAYSVDQLVSGRHFDAHLLTDSAGIDLVARKAVARSVSDLAAMGARPAWGLATALIPEGWSHADALFDAMARWARHWSCPFIGGDIAATNATAPLALTVTCAGTFDDGSHPVPRAGAKVGDVLYITGPLGGSLASGRHLTFEPRVEIGLRAAALPAVHAMIDLSDGLGLDAHRVALASGVRLCINTSSIPRHPGVASWQSAAGDGEDHELLLAIDPAHAERIASELALLGPIGAAEIAEPGAAGAIFRDARGVRHEGAAFGFVHAQDTRST